MGNTGSESSCSASLCQIALQGCYFVVASLAACVSYGFDMLPAASDNRLID
jgi:hypothetical protein